MLAGITIYKGDFLFVVTEVRTPKGGWISFDISEPLPLEISVSELGKILVEALVKSESGLYLEKGIEFWKKIGYKTFSSFSKKHECVDITKFEDCYRVMLWLNDRGGYKPSKNPSDIIELPLEALDENIGKACKCLFNKCNDDFEERAIIDTVNENKLSYLLPNLESFEDIGDGHTDAYQIFVNSLHKDSHIAFMIDSGYESFTEEDIKYSFEQYYGPLLDFDYQVIPDKLYKVRVIAKTSSREIVSCLFEDSGELLEVIYVIDLQAPETDVETIRQEFESVIQSIKIS